jgi:hypothetical protein
VGFRVGSSVGCAVGDSVGVDVVGMSVGAAVGISVGKLVGLEVGDFDGAHKPLQQHDPTPYETPSVQVNAICVAQVDA